MEKEGYRQVLIPESVYNRLLAGIEVKARPGTAQKPKPPTPTFCLTLIIQDPAGEQHVVCVGNCPWYKQLFGGDCTPRGGGCQCSWGILEPIIDIFR